MGYVKRSTTVFYVRIIHLSFIMHPIHSNIVQDVSHTAKEDIPSDCSNNNKLKCCFKKNTLSAFNSKELSPNENSICLQCFPRRQDNKNTPDRLHAVDYFVYPQVFKYEAEYFKVTITIICTEDDAGKARYNREQMYRRSVSFLSYCCRVSHFSVRPAHRKTFQIVVL